MLCTYIPYSHQVRRESQQEEVANRCRIIVLILLWLLLLLLFFSSPSPIWYSYTRNVCYFVFTITKSGGGRAIGPRRVFYDVAEKYELCCNTDHWNYCLHAKVEDICINSCEVEDTVAQISCTV
jgi:hypothetical protein